MKTLRPYFIIGLLLALLGWGGLVMLILFTLPTLWPRWLFFFLLMVGLSGTAMPVIAFLHRRFPTDPPSGHTAVIRESIWVGLYGNLLAWLQLGRVLSVSLIFFIAIGFMLIETLIRMRERSRWTPKESVDE